MFTRIRAEIEDGKAESVRRSLDILDASSHFIESLASIVKNGYSTDSKGNPLTYDLFIDLARTFHADLIEPELWRES